MSTRKNRRQSGGVIFSSNNVEYPELNSPEAPWASSPQNYYTLTASEISATSLDSIPGLTPAMKATLQRSGLISEAHLFFIATALSGKKYALADLLRSISVKHPVYLADLISQKVWHLWGVGNIHEGVTSDINFELGSSTPLSDYSKEKIYEYIWDHRMFDMLELLIDVGASKEEFINKYLEYIYDSCKFMKSLKMLDSASTLFNDSMLGTYIREKYGVDAYESFVRSLTGPVQRIRTFIRNNAFERRKHLLPYLPGMNHIRGAGAASKARRLRKTRRIHH